MRLAIALLVFLHGAAGLGAEVWRDWSQPAQQDFWAGWRTRPQLPLLPDRPVIQTPLIAPVTPFTPTSPCRDGKCPLAAPGATIMPPKPIPTDPDFVSSPPVLPQQPKWAQQPGSYMTAYKTWAATREFDLYVLLTNTDCPACHTTLADAALLQAITRRGPLAVVNATTDPADFTATARACGRRIEWVPTLIGYIRQADGTFKWQFWGPEAIRPSFLPRQGQ